MRSNTPFNPHGNSAMELKHMVDAGMTPIDALKAGTANAADLLRLADRGRLREGAAADLLVVAGDPTIDIDCAAVRAHHRLVVKDGTIVVDALAGRAGDGPWRIGLVAG